MNKQKADELILEYQKKIFGFAMDKLHNISEAEELAANIVYELYKAFLKSDLIVNIDGYVYRISQNIYSKYIDRKNKHNHLDIMNVPVAVADETFNKIEKEETYQKIRKEIGRLSNRQRTIIYMHYYNEMSVKEIATKLSISLGTVKWHLSDAKANLKEEMVMVKSSDMSVNPIKFISMGHSGQPGTSGDTSNMFDTRLKQNIAWSCYYQARNVKEIARELEVPIAYIESELQKLVEWGYIDQLDHSKNPKYLTNMYITDARIIMNQKDSNHTNLYKEAAKYLCDKFYLNTFAQFDKAGDNWGFSCPNNDKNFMKYTLVMLITKHMKENMFTSDWDKFAVRRPDGGHFISYATVSDDCTEIKETPYWCCGYMFREVWKDEKIKMNSIQVNCRYSERAEGWQDNLESDWNSLYLYIKNGRDKNKLKEEEYKRLCDKGYVANGEVQVMTLKTRTNNIQEAIDSQIEKYVQIPQEIIEYGKTCDEKNFMIQKDRFPEHMNSIVKYHCSNFLAVGEMIPYLVEEMLERGMLKPLTETQKKAVFSIICY